MSLILYSPAWQAGAWYSRLLGRAHRLQAPAMGGQSYEALARGLGASPDLYSKPRRYNGPGAPIGSRACEKRTSCPKEPKVEDKVRKSAPQA